MIMALSWYMLQRILHVRRGWHTAQNACPLARPEDER